MKKMTGKHMDFDVLPLFVLSAVMLFTANFVRAQEIPTISPDPEIKHGVLPNGMSWYVAVNPSSKGSADFALVQLVGVETATDAGREKIVSLSQEALSGQARLKSGTVQDFFTRHGALPRAGGFVDVGDNATIFRFGGVDLTQSQNVLDSALMVLMGVAERSFLSDDPLLKKWYAPSDHAVIVAGDVDAVRVEEKIRMLSYMVPSAVSAPRRDYVWEDCEGMQVNISFPSCTDLATVSAVWRLQRAPREYMNTVQPVIMERFMEELGFVARQRIRRRLAAEGIPVAHVGSRYDGSIGTLGDERFNVTLSVGEAHLMEAVSTLAETLASLDAGTAGIDEIRKASYRYMDGLVEREVNNRDYIDCCVSAFIFNSPLASGRHMDTFHSSKAVADSTVVSLFNSIASASLDKSRNLSLEIETSDASVSADSIKEVFQTSWEGGQGCRSEADVPQDRYLRLYGPAAEKVKVRSVRKEPMSGGTLWKLSNGMKIITKQLPSDGKVYYSFSLNGGYGNVKGLERGEGACMSDFLKACRFGGVDYGDFTDLLRQKGITIGFKVDFSSFRIEGRIPKDSADCMIRALLTVLNDRSVDEDKLSYILESEHIGRCMGDTDESVAAIDDIMYPDYRYTSCRTETLPGKNFYARAEAFFKSQSSKVNDGVLILVGDVDEKRLKDAVETYAGGFVTSDKAFSRPVVSYQPISGTVMSLKEGVGNRVDIALSAPVAITADNVYACEMALMALRKSFAGAAAGKGMCADFMHGFRRDPHERLGMLVSLSEAQVEGFASGTVHDAPVLALHTVRRLLDDMGGLEVSESELALYKKRLKERISGMMISPEYWRKALSRRYLDGKDFTSDYESKIDSVTADEIRALLGKLAEGARVELVITER